MVRLERNNYEVLLHAVTELGGATEPEQFARCAIEQVALIIGPDVVTINEIDPDAGRVAFHMLPEDFPLVPEADQILARIADQHPLILFTRETGDGSARRISDLWTQEKFKASEVYRLLYQPMGIEYQVAVTVSTPLPAMVGIAASRSDRDFSEHDRVMLNALRPHLAQGWRNAKEQIRLRSLLEAAGDAAAESGGGLIVLSDPPQEVTAGSVVQLYRYFGRPSRSGPMPTRVERWIDLQRARLSDSDAPRLLRPLTANLDGHSLVLRYLPAQGYHPGAIVLREDGHNLVGRDLQAFGLGEREAQVVRLLVTGASNAAIATALSISLATVKKHLENIYRKVGVHGRGPLTAYVLDFASS